MLQHEDEDVVDGERGGQDGESGLGLGYFILEGVGQSQGKSGTLGQGCGGYAAALSGSEGEEGWGATCSLMFVWLGGLVSLHQGFVFLFLLADLGLALGPGRAWSYAGLSLPKLTPRALLL